MPGYNELDRKKNPELTRKTKKYPYSKNEKITTAEMQRAKKSTMGVLPSSRQTTDLKDLNVLIEGQYPKPGKAGQQTEQDVNINMVENANMDTSAEYSEFIDYLLLTLYVCVIWILLSLHEKYDASFMLLQHYCRSFQRLLL